VTITRNFATELGFHRCPAGVPLHYSTYSAEIRPHTGRPVLVHHSGRYKTLGMVQRTISFETTPWTPTIGSTTLSVFPKLRNGRTILAEHWATNLDPGALQRQGQDLLLLFVRRPAPVYSATATQVSVPDASLRQNAPAALQPFLNAFPLPNGGEDGLNDGLAFYDEAVSNPSSLDSVSVRVDHSFGDKLKIFGRYADAPSKRPRTSRLTRHLRRSMCELSL